jgi:hypothetical protein
MRSANSSVYDLPCPQAAILQVFNTGNDPSATRAMNGTRMNIGSDGFCADFSGQASDDYHFNMVNAVTGLWGQFGDSYIATYSGLSPALVQWIERELGRESYGLVAYWDNAAGCWKRSVYGGKYR